MLKKHNKRNTKATLIPILLAGEIIFLFSASMFFPANFCQNKFPSCTEALSGLVEWAAPSTEASLELFPSNL